MTRSQLLAALFVALSVPGCSRRLILTEPVITPRDADVPSEQDAGALLLDDAGAVLCGNAPCACSNGLDDDEDGLTDGFDPECTAAFDDDELTFAAGVHGEDKQRKCSDCFFDGNSGRDDGCNVSSSCATTGQPSPGACNTCVASDSCVNNCLPLAPNGCDCFGCCEVRSAGLVTTTVLSDTCSLANLDVPGACPRCTPNRDCFNPCAECELCAGKTPSDLPASCGPPGSYVCEDAETCTPERPCAGGGYCVQGCCLPPLL